MNMPAGQLSGTAWAQRFRARYGPWAVVTGGSDGIGLAIAQQLAAAGLNLLLVARDATRLAGVATQLRDAQGVQCETLTLDLSKPGASAQLITHTERLDVGLLVAAAGFGSAGPLISCDLNVEGNMVDLNCRAVLEQATCFGRRLADRGSGGMILMSSLLAFQGVPQAANYAATKAYVQSLAEALHHELAPHGVDVLAAAPGPVHSGFAKRAAMTMGFGLEPVAVASATLRALGRRTVVRPGWLSWGLEASLAPLPRLWRTRILARVMAGMAAGRGAQTTE
ncbi:MAG: SDR family NAD(P)-dependent oxidoreductase [Burkholderiaceae bacterium]